MSAGVWLAVETNIGIVCACLPVMRPLISRVPSLPQSFTRIWSSFSSIRSTRSSSSVEKESSNQGLGKESKESDRVVLHSGKPDDLKSLQSSPSISESEKRKIETYRSEAEGYRHRSEDDGIKNGDKSNGRSLWIEHSIHTSTRQSGLEHLTFREEEPGY